MSYGRAMAQLAAEQPDRLAVLCGEASATRRQLEERSNQLARAYAALGVREGDRVTLALPNSVEFYVACLAIWKLGATPQPISSQLPERERRAIVDVASPALIVGVDAGEYRGLDSGDVPTIPPGFAPDPALPTTSLEDRIAASQRAMSSGGSTGTPKVIVNRSPASCEPGVAVNQMRAEGCVMVPGPLYHTGPFVVSWQGIFAGCTLVVLRRFDASQCLALIERHRVNWVLFVPTMMQRIWRLPERERLDRDLSSLEVVMSSGAPSPQWLKRAWIEWLGPEKIFEAYGGSENVGGTRISGSEWLAHPGSVGKPVFGARMKICDPEDPHARPLPPGEIGHVYIRPPGTDDDAEASYHYLGSPELPSIGGWVSLGDLGHMDADGYLYLVDRETDMIVSGGANVYPAEVEGAIDAHPAVRSSAVIGLPDDDLGQRVHAIVDAPGGVSDEVLVEHLALHLSRSKIPRSFEFVDEPLRDDAGKVRRSALREARLSAGSPPSVSG